MSLRRYATAATAIVSLAVPVAFSTTGVANAAQSQVHTVVITYNTNDAPDFTSAITVGMSHWNSSLHNVTLRRTTGPADLFFHEGESRGGSFYDGDSHGRGDILIDYRDAQVDDPIRIAAHETGHDLGLVDDYNGPCSELMSGGGPGPDCHNSYPDRYEAAQADTNFSYNGWFAPRDNQREATLGY